MGVRGFVAVFFRMDVGSAAGQQKPVAKAHDLVNIDAIGQGRNNHRRRTGNLCNRLDIRIAGKLYRILIIHHELVGDDTDDGFTHWYSRSRCNFVRMKKSMQNSPEGQPLPPLEEGARD